MIPQRENIKNTGLARPKHLDWMPGNPMSTEDEERRQGSGCATRKTRHPGLAVTRACGSAANLAEPRLLGIAKDINVRDTRQTAIDLYDFALCVRPS